MQYNPDDINATLIPDKTECEFQVLTSTDKVSSSGNPMIELVLNVWDAEGQEHRVWDYITKGGLFKLEQLCAIHGIDFTSGNVPAEDLAGISGKCVVGFKKGDGQYADKNSIRKYLTPLDEKNPPAPTKKPSDPNGVANSDAAKKRAWDDFKTANPGLTGEKLKVDFSAFVHNIFPSKDPKTLTGTQWDVVSDQIRNPVMAPDDGAMKDSEIPF